MHSSSRCLTRICSFVKASTWFNGTRGLEKYMNAMQTLNAIYLINEGLEGLLLLI